VVLVINRVPVVWTFEVLDCECSLIEEPTAVAALRWQECWPDVRDPATWGCLLALVRKAWNDPYAHITVMQDTGGRVEHVCWIGLNPRESCASEAEALLRALQEAPCPT